MAPADPVTRRSREPLVRGSESSAMATVRDLAAMQGDDLDVAATPMIRRCHEVMRKDVDDLTVEDLRLLIGQGIALHWLVPIAVDLVVEEPLTSGDLLAGDLFSALLGVQESYWASDPSSWLALHGVAEQIANTGELARDWLARTRGGA